MLPAGWLPLRPPPPRPRGPPAAGSPPRCPRSPSYGDASQTGLGHSYHLIFTLITFSKILYLHMLRHQELNMQIWGAEFSAQHACAAENREKDPEFVNLNRILLWLSHHSGGCQRVLPGPTVWPGSLGEMQVLGPPPGTTKSESRGPRLRHLRSNKFCRSSLRCEIMQGAGPVTHASSRRREQHALGGFAEKGETQGEGRSRGCACRGGVLLEPPGFGQISQVPTAQCPQRNPNKKVISESTKERGKICVSDSRNFLSLVWITPPSPKSHESTLPRRHWHSLSPKS